MEVKVKMQEPEEQLNSDPPAEAVGGEETQRQATGCLHTAVSSEGEVHEPPVRGKASGERVGHQRRWLETSCRGDLGQG